MAELLIPDTVDEVLRTSGSLLALSVSGGKDSQAMSDHLALEHARRGWRADICLVHAHLGRAEWPQTLAHVRNHGARLGLQTVIVRRKQGDMLQRWEQHFTKMQRLSGTLNSTHQLSFTPRPMNHWSTEGDGRYCTAELKRGQINQLFTGGQGPNQHGWDLVVCAEGLRIGEGTKRAKRLLRSGPLEVRPMVSGKAILEGVNGKPAPELAWRRWHRLSRMRDVRLALDWYPIMRWTTDDVFRAGGSSLADVIRRRRLWEAGDHAAALEQFAFHPAYAMGNERLSCALCILACAGDWQNGILSNPRLAGSLIRMERGSGWAFGNGGRSVEQTARNMGLDPETLLVQAYPFGEVV